MVTDAVKRVCPFCGSTPLTREHVWPQWLRKLDDLPLGVDPDHDWSKPHTIERYRFNGREMVDESIQRRARPPLMEVQVRAVCGACNNGWMSDLEQEAMPLLKRMILNEQFELDADDLRLLSFWAFKTAGMFQMDDPWTRTIDEAALREARVTRAPAAGATVRVFQTATTKNAMRLRNVAAFITGPVAAIPDTRQKNVSTTLLCAYRVGLMVTFSRHPRARSEYIGRGVRRVWPPASNLAWPPPDLVSDEDVERASLHLLGR